MSGRLEIRDVGFAYGSLEVFRDLTLTVDAGEMTAVLGPNGSGKTTLLRLVSGAARPVCGTIALDGEPLDRMSPTRRARRMAVVPQETRIDFDFGVRELVAMGRAPHQGLLGLEGPADAAAIERSLRAMRVDDLAGRRYQELSGGERQRVIIARALAQETPWLLLDEPTAHLDLEHRLRIYSLLRRLNAERGLTILLVSHDVNLAARYCGRVVLLKDGEPRADGAPENVLTEETLRDVYGVRAAVERAADSRPYVIPLEPLDER